MEESATTEPSSSKTFCVTTSIQKQQLLTTTLLSRDEDELWNESNTQSIPVAIINLVKSLLGAAMLSMPWAFSYSTFIPGLMALFFSATYAFITCMFIVNACEITQIYEYSALLRMVHPFWEKLAVFIIIYVCFSSCLSYIILIADFITHGIDGINCNLRFDHDRQIYVSIICIFIILPLSLLKKLDSLKVSSIIGNISTLYCVLLAVLYAFYRLFIENKTNNNKLPDGFKWNEWNLQILIVTNICAKGYASCFVIPPMYQQLRNRTVIRMRFVIICAFSTVTTIYCLFGISGYYLFGINIEGDVLNNFSNKNICFIIARFAMAISVIGTYPFIFKPFIQLIEDKWFNKEHGDKYNFIDYPKIRRIIICICSFILMIIGILINNVGPVSSIEGAVTILGLISFFPILIAHKVEYIKQYNQCILQQQQQQQIELKHNEIMIETKKTNNYNNKNRSRRIIYTSYLGILLLLGIGLGIGGIILQIKLVI